MNLGLAHSADILADGFDILSHIKQLILFGTAFAQYSAKTRV